MKYKLRLLSLSIGILYVLFGALKFFPSLSPAEDIGIATAQMLSFNLLSPQAAIILLASFEIGVGILLLCNKCQKVAIILAVCHLVLTFSPFFLFPDQVFHVGSYGPSLLGQYIFKNIVLLSALFLLYPSKRDSILVTN